MGLGVGNQKLDEAVGGGGGGSDCQDMWDHLWLIGFEGLEVVSLLGRQADHCTTFCSSHLVMSILSDQSW